MEIFRLLLCMLHGYTHSVMTQIFWFVFSCNWCFWRQKSYLFYSGSLVHLLPVSGHSTPVDSQHLLSGKKGPLYFFRWAFQAGKAKDDWPVVRHKTSWSRNLRALSRFPGWWLSCLSRLSVIFAAVLIPSGCQLCQPVLRGYLCCCQFSCLNWESFNAGDWDSWRGGIWSIPDNGMADIVFVVRLMF